MKLRIAFRIAPLAVLLAAMRAWGADPKPPEWVDLDAKRVTQVTEYMTRAQDEAAKLPGESLGVIAVERLIAVKARLGDFDGARKMAGDMPQRRIEIARAQAERGDAAGARETFKEARGLVGQNDDFQMMVLGDIQSHFGDWDGGKETAEAMPMVLLRADVMVTLAEELLLAGDHAGAKTDLADARKILEQSGEAMGELAAAYGKVGDLTAAREYIAGMKAKFDQADAWARLGLVQIDAGDKAGAMTSASESDRLLNADDGGAVDKRLKVRNWVGEILGRCGEKPGANEVYAHARKEWEARVDDDGEDGKRLQGLRAIALSQWKAQTPDVARETLEGVLAVIDKSPDMGIRIRAYWSIAKERAQGGDLEGAHAMIAKVLDLSGQDGGAEWLNVDTGFAIQGLAAAIGTSPNPDFAWIEKLRSPQERANACAGAALGLSVRKKK